MRIKVLLAIITLVIVTSCKKDLPVFDYRDVVYVERDSTLYIKRYMTVVTGVVTNYYENGQLGMESTFNEGKEDGLRRVWNKNGQLIEQTTYKNGVEVAD